MQGGARTGATTAVEPRYELGELTASGGMADVYEGHDRVLDRRVAIKRLRGSVDDPTTRARFEREARLLAGFGHPNAVTVFDALDDDAGPLIVMEYVEGATLRARLLAAQRLPVATAATIADQVLAALGAAHAHGIVHRDVKPGNVLVTTDGHVKLADFGIATMVDAADLTHAGEVIGTPRYLSPEQARGERATPRSDLYAVGVLCFEMVCGRVPFEAESPAATMVAHRDEPVPSLRTQCPSVPEWYVAVVERALAKDPADRFPDAAAMQAALRAGLRDEVGVVAPTVALPVTVLPDPPAGTRERRVPWPVLLFVLAGALVALGVWALGSDDAPRTRRPAPAGATPTVPPTVAPTTTSPTQPPSTGAPAVVVPVPSDRAGDDDDGGDDDDRGPGAEGNRGNGNDRGNGNGNGDRGRGGGDDD